MDICLSQSKIAVLELDTKGANEIAQKGRLDCYKVGSQTTNNNFYHKCVFDVLM